MRKLLYTEQWLRGLERVRRTNRYVALLLVLCLPWPCFLHADSCLLAVTGLFKYGVAHYEPPASTQTGKAIKTPVRPAVEFHNAEAVIDIIELDEDDLLLEDHPAES